MWRRLKNSWPEGFLILAGLTIGLAFATVIESQRHDCNLSRRVLVNTATMCYLYPYDDDPWPHHTQEDRLRACVDMALDISFGKGEK